MMGYCRLTLIAGVGKTEELNRKEKGVFLVFILDRRNLPKVISLA
jgi:hypothetical protein